MLAPARALCARLPEELSPLLVVPGLGLISRRVCNDAGGTDLALSAATPAQTSFRTSYTSFQGAWHATSSQTNMLSAGGSRFPRGVTLEIGEGRKADDLRSLRPITNVGFDVVTEGQLALHMPTPISV